MSDIIMNIQVYKEDHPEVVLTDDIIKGVILENIDKLIEEIKEEI